MNVAKSLIATLVLAAASLAPSAQATVIDFNNLAGTNAPGNDFVADDLLTQFNPGSTYTNGDFKFTGASYGYLIGTSYSGGDSSYFAYNGTDYFMAYGVLTISSATATPFTVNGLDLTHWSDYGQVTQATLTGHKVGGGTVTQVANVYTSSNAGNHIGSDFNTLSLSGFDNLTSLTITHGGDDYLAMDNFVVNATTVPEPSSLALLGLAIAGCAFMRRRVGKAA